MAYETFQIDKRINKVYKLEKKVTKKRQRKEKRKESNKEKRNVFKFFRIFYILLIYFHISQSSYELYNTKEKSL